MENYRREAKIFKTLMHPARLAILDVLRAGEECVCHLEAHLGYRQAYISQHLMVLREAGLVEDRRDGWNIYYRVTRPEVFEVVEAAAHLVGGTPSPQQSPDSVRVHETPCPCPKCSPPARASEL